jgi:hypothetical protein
MKFIPSCIREEDFKILKRFSENNNIPMSEIQHRCILHYFEQNLFYLDDFKKLRNAYFMKSLQTDREFYHRINAKNQIFHEKVLDYIWRICTSKSFIIKIFKENLKESIEFEKKLKFKNEVLQLREILRLVEKTKKRDMFFFNKLRKLVFLNVSDECLEDLKEIRTLRIASRKFNE